MTAQVLPPPQTAHSFKSSFSSAPQTKPVPLQRTNYGSPIDPDMVDWLTPTPKDTPLSDIRARYSQEGYVWIKNVIPRSDIFDMRERYFQAISPSGLLSPDTGPREGIFNSRLDPTAHQGLGATPPADVMENLDQIHASKEYQDFLHHPDLGDWVRRVTGWQREAVLKRGLLRHNVPGSKCPSGIHYDQLFLRAGDPAFVTAWVPLGDCAADGGGLMYLENSCELGERVEKRFESQQEKENMTKEERISAYNRHMGELGHLSHNAETWAKEDGLGKRWLVGNYEAGDVVFHSPWMIHASSQNSDKFGRIRLASDLRFYEDGARLDQRWTKPYFDGDGLTFTLPFDDPDAITTSRIFSDIYERHLWGKSLSNTPFSGPGSHNAVAVDPYVSVVRRLIADNFVTPPDAVDLGCGDFNVGKQIRNVTDRYIACDIVPHVVNYNRLVYASEDVDFQILDLVTEVLPAGDIVFVRQVLQHLRNDQISRFLPKLKNYRWLILTESIPAKDPFVPNHDMETGEFARLDFNSGVDLTKRPFNLKHYNATVLSEIFGSYHKDGAQDRIRTTAYQLQRT